MTAESHRVSLENLKLLTHTAEQSRDSHAISHVIRLIQSILTLASVRHKGVEQGGVMALDSPRHCLLAPSPLDVENDHWCVIITSDER